MDTLEAIVAENSMHDPVSPLVSEEAIRERAYEIYERHGRQDGRAKDDWLQAEIELRNEAQAQPHWT